MSKYFTIIFLLSAQVASGKHHGATEFGVGAEDLEMRHLMSISPFAAKTLKVAPKSGKKTSMKGKNKQKSILLEELSLNYAVSEMSLPIYSEFGLAPKSNKVPLDAASLSLPFAEVSIGSKTQKSPRPANKSKKPAKIAKGSEKEQGAEAVTVDKKSKKEKNDKSDSKKKSQKAVSIPALVRSIIPEEVTSSSNTDELTEADFASAANAENNASFMYATIGALALTILFGTILIGI